ncbi:hypothetical protein H4582DRAFT_1097917 [Lactarius indigo]|nr:hypothetical protein H4582DRAFT_1097917 [Lactarius indigo]
MEGGRDGVKTYSTVCVHVERARAAAVGGWARNSPSYTSVRQPVDRHTKLFAVACASGASFCFLLSFCVFLWRLGSRWQIRGSCTELGNLIDYSTAWRDIAIKSVSGFGASKLQVAKLHGCLRRWHKKKYRNPPHASLLHLKKKKDPFNLRCYPCVPRRGYRVSIAGLGSPSGVV